MWNISPESHPRELRALTNRTADLGFTMASEPKTGALLRMLAASKPGGRFVELGTGTGIATAWLLSGMDRSSSLISVDMDQNVQRVAREILGEDPRLTLVTEDGTAFLRQQPAKSFDLVFADAMPGKYEALDEALAMVKPGGYYVIDDLLPQPNWPEGHAEKVPGLMGRLLTDERFQALPLEWASGLAVLVRKSA
jgi:predicted O-methyltransferase YrrM